MKLYLAAALFSEAERRYNATIADELRAAGHEVYVPQEHEQKVNKPGYAWRIWYRNTAGLAEAEGVVAILEGADGDSGTAWECGYAWAKGKPIFALRTDFRNAGPEEQMNLQVEQGCKVVCRTIGGLLMEIRRYVQKWEAA